MNSSDRESQDFISSTVVYSFFYCFHALIMVKTCFFSRSDILMNVQHIVSSFRSAETHHSNIIHRLFVKFYKCTEHVP